MSGVTEMPDQEDRALLHLVTTADSGIKGLVLDLIRASEGNFQHAPAAIRRVMEDLLLGMRLNGASDAEIERRFCLGRGGAGYLEHALRSRIDRTDARRHWRRMRATVEHAAEAEIEPVPRPGADQSA